MIFATVGTQLPFRRMFDSLESVASKLTTEIIAQTADPHWHSDRIETHVFLTPQHYGEIFGRADLIISHAGIGTVLMAIARQKPLIVMPRRASLGEHRNEHQLATVNMLKDNEGIYVVQDSKELGAVLSRTDLRPAKSNLTPQRKALQDYVTQQARKALGYD
jgi:UDP-N-acetylglucosamine transferase subunit ALG13